MHFYDIWIKQSSSYIVTNGPLTRYVKSRDAHALGKLGIFFVPLTSKEPASFDLGVRDSRAVMLVGIANPQWWGKRSQHSRRMRNPQYLAFRKRPTGVDPIEWLHMNCTVSEITSNQTVWTVAQAKNTRDFCIAALGEMNPLGNSEQHPSTRTHTVMYKGTLTWNASQCHELHILAIWSSLGQKHEHQMGHWWPHFYWYWRGPWKSNPFWWGAW